MKTLQTFLDLQARANSFRDWEHAQEYTSSGGLSIIRDIAQGDYITYLESVIKQKEEDLLLMRKVAADATANLIFKDEELLKAKETAWDEGLRAEFLYNSCLDYWNGNPKTKPSEPTNPYKAKINSSEIPNSSKEVKNDN